MTDPDFLVWLADSIHARNCPEVCNRLLSIAHSLRLLQELADEVVGAEASEIRASWETQRATRQHALEAHKRMTDAVKTAAGNALARICKEHGRP